MKRHAAQISMAAASFFVWMFVVLVPVHISFAYTYGSSYGTANYQLYWCNGYYSYAPCQPQYQHYPAYYYYTYPQYYYQPYYYYYPYVSGAYGAYGYNYSMNTNYNYNYNGWY